MVRQAAQAVEAHYIFEEDARVMSERLLAALADGTFSASETVHDLADAMTKTLHSVREDLHLVAIPWLPTNAEADDDSGWLQAWRETWPRNNHGFSKLEILLGNVGYLDLRMFPTAEAAGPTTAAAMQFLADTRALIFDLRDNGGGEDSVYLLMSYLFDEPTHVHTACYRGREEQAWTYGHVPGPRFSDHPAYALTSRSSFSAAEDFAYNLQQLGRITVVGERTRGGAHPVEYYRYPETFLELMIPNAYSMNPKTGTNWEDSGVIPDIEVPADEALGVAHRHALEAVIERAESEDDRRFARWAQESLRARNEPYAPDASALGNLAGRYGSSTEIGFLETQLTLCRGGRRTYVLEPMNEHRFQFDGGRQRVTFLPQVERVTEILWETQDGDAWRMNRQA
jgi:hypothetical protein